MWLRSLLLYFLGFLATVNLAQAADYLYVSFGDNTIGRYDVSLSSVDLIESSAQKFVNTNLMYVWGITFDSSGNLYAANAFSISKFDSSGNFLATIGDSTNVYGARNVTFDSFGNLYVTNESISTISIFDSSGIYQSNITSNLLGPTGIGFNSSGNLYVANAADNTVSIFDPSGVYLSKIDTYLEIPIDLMFDSSGNLYVANYGGSLKLSKYDSSGNYLGQIGTFPDLNYPYGIEIDAAGNIYVTTNASDSSGEHFIAKYNASGVFQYRWSTGTKMAIGLAFVPEPSTYILGTLSALTLAIIARRKRRVVLA
jgi:DNA-binding beta-propeller fold protein YncE